MLNRYYSKFSRAKGAEARQTDIHVMPHAESEALPTDLKYLTILAATFYDRNLIPLVMQYLRYRDILNLRLTCKKLHIAIQPHWITNPATHFSWVAAHRFFQHFPDYPRDSIERGTDFRRLLRKMESEQRLNDELNRVVRLIRDGASAQACRYLQTFSPSNQEWNIGGLLRDVFNNESQREVMPTELKDELHKYALEYARKYFLNTRTGKYDLFKKCNKWGSHTVTSFFCMLGELELIKQLHAEHPVAQIIKFENITLPIYTAMQYKRHDIVRYLVEFQIPYRKNDPEFVTCLVLVMEYAAYHGLTELAAELLACNVNPFIRKGHFYALSLKFINFVSSAFNKACYSGHLDIIELYFNSVFTEEVQQHHNDYTSMQYAAIGGQPHVMEYLMKRGYSLEGAISQACRAGRLDVIRFILDQQPDEVNGRDDRGQSALTLAAAFNSLPIVQYLIQQGAKLDVKSTIHERFGTQLSEFHCAAMQKNSGVLKYLITLHSREEVAAIINDDPLIIHYACRDGCTETVNLLLEARPDLLNHRDPDGKTPIMTALRNLNPGILQLLIKQGADLTITDDNGNTLMHHAAIAGDVCWNSGTLSAVLQLGISPLIANNQGQTPIAACRYDDGKKKLFELESYIWQLRERIAAAPASGSLFVKSKSQWQHRADAAQVLKDVILGYADKSMLQLYQDELKHNELGKFCRYFKNTLELTNSSKANDSVVLPLLKN